MQIHSCFIANLFIGDMPTLIYDVCYEKPTGFIANLPIGVICLRHKQSASLEYAESNFIANLSIIDMPVFVFDAHFPSGNLYVHKREK